MPPFGHTFNEDQLQALAAYVYALSHGGGSRK
jgi:mono/diheme cytochrome c family protein